MVCDICGKDGAQVRCVSRSYGCGASLFVIENVPLVSCPNCGESYLTAETLHEIEQHQAASAHMGARTRGTRGGICVTTRMAGYSCSPKRPADIEDDISRPPSTPLTPSSSARGRTGWPRP